MIKNWTGLKIDKETGETSDFFIFKDGKETLKYDIEEARKMFPKAVYRLEQTAFFYMIFGK